MINEAQSCKVWTSGDDRRFFILKKRLAQWGSRVGVQLPHATARRHVHLCLYRPCLWSLTGACRSCARHEKTKRAGARDLRASRRGLVADTVIVVRVGVA